MYMTNEQKILNIIDKNNGYITSKDIIDESINHVFLSRMVKKGILEKYSKGYYGLPSYLPDSYFIVLSKSKYAIYSHSTALYFHDLSDRTPLNLDITVPNHYGGVLQKTENITLYTVSEDVLNLGMMEMESPLGMNIKVYDMERTICDIIKAKNKMDAEIFSKALKNYVKRTDKKLSVLFKYTKQLNIEEKVRDYIEVLL